MSTENDPPAWFVALFCVLTVAAGAAALYGATLIVRAAWRS